MPISAPRDDNRITTLLGTLDSDGETVIAIKANPSNHAIKLASGTTGSSFSSTASKRDANRKTTIWGVSSADGVTPIYIATDSSGNILIDIT